MAVLAIVWSTPWAQDDSAGSGLPGGGRNKLKVQPTLTFDQTYTDNLTLRPSGAAKSDWVTSVRPGVSVSGVGGRVRVNATYTAELLQRAQEGTGSVRHQLAGSANAELVQRLLFIDANTSVSQQNVSLLGPQAESNINNTGNRTSVTTTRVSPYLRRDFGSDAQGEARFTFSTVGTSSSTGAAADSQANRIDLRLSSGPAFSRTTWNLAYMRENIDYTGRPATTSEKITAGGRRLITPNIGVLGTLGHESNNFSIGGSAPQAFFWSLGPEWTPTPRTRLAATIGQRVFGSSRSLDFSHRTRLTVWNASYSEDISSTRSQALIPTAVDTASIVDALFLSRVPDPAVRQQVVQAYIAQNGLPQNTTVPLNFLTNQNFLIKQLRASVGIQGVRNTVIASGFTSTREAETSGLPATGDFALSSTTKQTGASLTWSLKMTSQTSTNLSLGYTLNEFPATRREDELKHFRFGVNHQFSPRTSGTVNYRRAVSESNQVGAGYTENVVAALINIRF